MKKFLFKQRFKFSVVELVVFGIALRFSYQHSTLSNIIVVVGLVLLVGDWVLIRRRNRNRYLPHQHMMIPKYLGAQERICCSPLVRKSDRRGEFCPHTDVRKMRKDGSFE